MSADTHILLRRGERTIRIEGRSAVIGRSNHCHVVCSDNGISRRHCELLVTDGGLILRDLGSRHGTFVDGRQIGGETPVQSGAIVSLGRRGSQYLISGAVLEGRQITGTHKHGAGPVTTVTGVTGLPAGTTRPDSSQGMFAEQSTTAMPPGGITVARDQLLAGIIWGVVAGLVVGLIGVLALG